MYAIVSPEKLELPEGAVVRLLGNWQDYLALYNQRGENHSLPRIKYRFGEILLMAPLAAHGREAHLLAMIAIALLDHQSQDHEAFTPITMTLPEVSGIEPDYCFYIEHWQAIAGKKRINWEVDPAPDLVIEIDVTSYTDINDYLPYRVPEVWLFKSDRLRIFGLDGNEYQLQSSSRYFPDRKIFEIVDETSQLAYRDNSSAAIRALRQKLALE